MPRTRRMIPIDSAIHIMCRGNNRQKVFTGDVDKLYYWRLLKNLKEGNQVELLHYCIMDNHVHLIVWVRSQSKLSKFMKQVNLSYFGYYKKRYGYWGHIWQGRYKSNVIDGDAYLLHCGKYIELNPVRAGIVKSPDEYVFSSYRHYSTGYGDGVISDSPAYLGLSNEPKERKKLYSSFVVDGELVNSDKLLKQVFIGSEGFIRKLRLQYGLREAISKGGRPRKVKT